MKFKSLYFDPWITFIVFLFSLLALINFFSVSYFYSLKFFNNPLYFFERFAFKVTLSGIAVFIIGNILSKKIFTNQRITLFLFFILYLSLILVFLPPFSAHDSVHRWLNLGFISFQPSELIKPIAILFIIFISSNMKKLSLINKIFIFLVFLLALIIPIFFQPALSNIAILASSLILVFFIFLSNKKEFFLSILVFLILMILILLFSTQWEYRKERFISFLTKGSLFSEKYFQVQQSMLAVSLGGLWGKGIGNSDIKISGLPQMLTDSIFAIYAEEFGFMGSLLLLFLYLWLILRIILLGKKVNHIEKASFALAVSLWLTLQIFIHISSNIGLFIPTGVVLPFLSYGASAQLAIYFSLGIISAFKT